MISTHMNDKRMPNSKSAHQNYPWGHKNPKMTWRHQRWRHDLWWPRLTSERSQYQCKPWMPPPNTYPCPYHQRYIFSSSRQQANPLKDGVSIHHIPNTHNHTSHSIHISTSHTRWQIPRPSPAFWDGLLYATLQTTLRYVCFFGQNWATELRYVIFCYVAKLRKFLINVANKITYYTFSRLRLANVP